MQRDVPDCLAADPPAPRMQRDPHGFECLAAEPPAPARASAPSRRTLLLNAILFSFAFAVLEGCVSATIVISHAVVPPELASTSNAILYLSFSITTFVSPAIVAAAGVKPSLVASMAAYSLYCVAYMAPLPPVLYAAGVVGGIAGAVLWTAQGVYYTANALQYTDAVHAELLSNPSPQNSTTPPTSPCRPALSGPQRSPSSDGRRARRALDLFAGLFAFFFQASLALGKPLAGLCLTIWPDTPAVLFGAYTSVALACTCGMACVRPLATPAASLRAGTPRRSKHRPERRTSASGQHTPPFASPLSQQRALSGHAHGRGEVPGRHMPPFASPLSQQQQRAFTSGHPQGRSEVDLDTPVAAAARLATADPCDAAAASPAEPEDAVAPLPPTGLPTSLRASLCGVGSEPEDALAPLPPTGLRASLCGAGSLYALLLDRRMALLAPTNAAFGLMTALFPAVVSPLIADAYGAAAVGWHFALAGATAAAVTLAVTAIARGHPAGRDAALLAGALLFGAAAGRIVACASECAALAESEWRGVFVAYGCGVAVWQSCVMALVGEMSHDWPHGAFAHLKLTSALSSFFGFVLLPKLATRDAAALCLAAVGAGALSLVALLALRRETRPSSTTGGTWRRGTRLLSVARPSAPVVHELSSEGEGGVGQDQPAADDSRCRG